MLKSKLFLIENLYMKKLKLLISPFQSEYRSVSVFLWAPIFAAACLPPSLHFVKKILPKKTKSVDEDKIFHGRHFYIPDCNELVK